MYTMVTLVDSHGMIPRNRRKFVVPPNTTISFLPEYGTVGYGGIGNKTHGAIIGPRGSFTSAQQSKARKNNAWLSAIRSATGLSASTYHSGEIAPNLDLIFVNKDVPEWNPGVYSLPRDVRKRQRIRKHRRGKSQLPTCRASNFRDGHYIFAGCRQIDAMNINNRDISVARNERTRRQRRTRHGPNEYDYPNNNRTGVMTKIHTKGTRSGVYYFNQP